MRVSGPRSDRKYVVSMALAAKLAGVVVHADELLDMIARTDGDHDVNSLGFLADRAALATAARDPEVQAWVRSLGPLAPVKRDARVNPG